MQHCDITDDGAVIVGNEVYKRDIDGQGYTCINDYLVRLFQDIDGRFHRIDDIYSICYNMLDKYWAVMINGVKYNISHDTYNTLNVVYDVNNKAKRKHNKMNSNAIDYNDYNYTHVNGFCSPDGAWEYDGFGWWIRKENDQTAKADEGKPRLSLVPTEIINCIARVREYGITKYTDPDNWKRVSTDRYHDALFRHIIAYINDPASVDEESGLPHLWHIATNCAFLCELEKKSDI